MAKDPKLSKVLRNARASLRILQTLEKETVARAKGLVKRPLGRNRKRLTNERILESLLKLGLASRKELALLQARVERIESLLSIEAPETGSLRSSREHSGAIPGA